MNTIDSAPFAIFLLPLIFGILWLLLAMGVLAFAVVMVIRFVRAHERIAKNLETIAQRLPAETREKLPPPARAVDPAPAPKLPTDPSDFSPRQ
ncbi:MAG TPA: hypothetical protein VIM61_08630 [Chthoniobacterales bacterium]|jgi:hypothetical protein